MNAHINEMLDGIDNFNYNAFVSGRSDGELIYVLSYLAAASDLDKMLGGMFSDGGTYTGSYATPNGFVVEVEIAGGISSDFAGELAGAAGGAAAGVIANGFGGNNNGNWEISNKGDSETNASKNETPINQGTSKPPQKSTPNSVYEQLNPDGTVKSRAFYDENGNQFNRQDFDHTHCDKNTQQDLQPHEHNYQYNEDGLPNGNSAGPLKPGYDNKPTN